MPRTAPKTLDMLWIISGGPFSKLYVLSTVLFFKNVPCDIISGDNNCGWGESNDHVCSTAINIVSCIVSLCWYPDMSNFRHWTLNSFFLFSFHDCFLIYEIWFKFTCSTMWYRKQDIRFSSFRQLSYQMSCIYIYWEKSKLLRSTETELQ